MSNYLYSDPCMSRRTLVFRVLRRGSTDLLHSARDTVVLIAVCWIPLLMPALAELLHRRIIDLACGATAVVCLVLFAALLRARSRRPISTGLVLALGLGVVGVLALVSLPPGDTRIYFLLGALLGGLLSAAGNFVAYTVNQVKREAAYR